MQTRVFQKSVIPQIEQNIILLSIMRDSYVINYLYVLDITILDNIKTVKKKI